MDDFDRKILRELQTDSGSAVSEIAQRVGLSTSPCWKRIQRLERDGLIDKRVALLNAENAGFGLTVFVSVRAREHSPDWLETFAQAVRNMPEVLEFYRMAGDVDYMLKVVARDVKTYDEFYKRLIKAAPLSEVTSRFAMEAIKYSTALPV